jgi:CBS domain-containing protein
MEIASKKRLCAKPDQEIDEVADLFKREQVRKIAVVENGKVVGVISQSAILRHILTMILPEKQ